MISCENAKTSRVNLGSLRSDLVKALQDEEGWFEEAGHHGPVLLLLLVLYQQVLKLDLVAVHPEGLDGLKVGPVVDLDQQGVVLAGQLGDQVCLLAQFYSVDFSQSRIGVNKCVFYKRTIEVSVSCC